MILYAGSFPKQMRAWILRGRDLFVPFWGSMNSAILNILGALGPGPCGGPLKLDANLKLLWDLLIWLKNFIFFVAFNYSF